MRHILYTIALFFTLCAVVASQGCGSGAQGADIDSGADAEEDFDRAMELVERVLADTAPTVWDLIGPMPDDDIVRLHVDCPPGRLHDVFCDSNILHYEAGERLGVEPIDRDSLVWPVRRPLVRIASNRHYCVDELRYSYPYLVPEGKRLLDDISRRFHDSLAARGGGDYRLKITSLLRTRHSVARLRRVNRASVDSSAHLFGTTFDISFTYFPYSGAGPHRSQDDLKSLLAEILYLERSEGRCLVVYEHRPGCFHITATR